MGEPKANFIEHGQCSKVKKANNKGKGSKLGNKVYMGNSATSEIKCQGKVVLKMTFGNELTLTNVLYVPEIRKNLVFGSLLNSHGFWLVFEFDKFVLSKSGIYVGKGYMSDDM